MSALEEKLNALRAERDVINTLIASVHKELKQKVPQAANMKTTLFPIVRDYNCTIGSLDVLNERELVFSNQLVNHYQNKTDILPYLLMPVPLKVKVRPVRNGKVSKRFQRATVRLALLVSKS